MKHRFCLVTGHCEKCGLTKMEFTSSGPVITCYSAGNVTSLRWYRKWRAHFELKDQLTASLKQAES